MMKMAIMLEKSKERRAIKRKPLQDLSAEPPGVKLEAIE
jgi:hypothetical protein